MNPSESQSKNLSLWRGGDRVPAGEVELAHLHDAHCLQVRVVQLRHNVHLRAPLQVTTHYPTC